MEHMEPESHTDKNAYVEPEARRVEDVIEEDHRQVESKLDALLANDSLSTNDKRDLFNEIKRDVLHHILAEENCFYPAVEKFDEVGSEQIRESEQEHHQVKLILNELDDVPVEDEIWQAKLKVLCEDLEHHHREEEEEILPVSRQRWSDEEAREIGRKFISAKKKANL